jgi:hypothetical protein
VSAEDDWNGVRKERSCVGQVGVEQAGLASEPCRKPEGLINEKLEGI